MVEVIKVVTQRPVPPNMTGAQWIRYQRLQAGLLIAIALIIAFLTLAVVAMVKSPEKHRLADIKISFQGGRNKVATIARILSQSNMGFTVVFDRSVPDEKKKQLVTFDTNLNNLPLLTFLDIFCDRAGNLAYSIDSSTNIITT